MLVVSVVSVSLSVGVVWCGCYRCCGVACPLLSGGLSSMRCLLYLDVHTRRGTSFGYLYQGHGFSCRLSAPVRIPHQVDIPSSALKSHCVNTFETIAKKETQRQRWLVVHVRSAIHRELARTQPKLEGKCVNVGVDALAVVR